MVLMVRPSSLIARKALTRADAPAIVVRTFESGLLITAIGGIGMLFNYLMQLYLRNRNGENN